MIEGVLRSIYFLRPSEPFVRANDAVYDHANVHDLPTDATPLDYECVDLSRIPPKAYLQNEKAIDDFRVEVCGSLAGTTCGPVAPLEIVALQGHFQRHAQISYDACV